jgi:hypothetical protein
MSMYGNPPIPPQPGAWLGPTTSGPIANDVTCRKCSYNLRGLTADGRCPECGTAVGFSLQGDLLRFCDPNWVDTLRRGTAVFIGGVAFMFLGLLGILFLVPMAIMPPLTVIQVCLIAILIGYILSTIGWWFLTQPDPSGLGEDKYGTSRKIIRICLIVGVVQSGFAVMANFVTMEDTLLMLLGVFSLISMVVADIGLIAQLYYLERLALRIPDNLLSARAHFLMYALGISYALFQGINHAVRVLGIQEKFTCFNFLLVIVVLIFFVMYLLMVEKMGKRFKEQAEIARRSWAATAFTSGQPPV